MTTNTPSKVAGATISECGKYRYRLWRYWESEGRPLPIIMLNPSTADGETDDPTIRKCIGFAKRLGFGGIEVFNLFAFRATDPKELRANHYQIGPDNDKIITARLHELGLHERGYVVLAWGANASNLQRPKELMSHLAMAGVRLRALALTRDGTPAHPLMLPYSCTPIHLNGDAVKAKVSS